MWMFMEVPNPNATSPTILLLVFDAKPGCGCCFCCYVGSKVVVCCIIIFLSLLWCELFSITREQVVVAQQPQSTTFSPHHSLSFHYGQVLELQMTIDATVCSLVNMLMKVTIPSFASTWCLLVYIRNATTIFFVLCGFYISVPPSLGEGHKHSSKP